MNLRQLQYAVMLAQTRNFSQVAQELSISQPALSKQIIALETELGIKLFDRNTTPLTLTQAGEFFLPRARELLFEEEMLVKTLERFKTGEFGKLSIGVAPFRSLYLMPPVVQALKEQYPQLQLSLAEYGRTQLLKGLNDGVYDFIITNLPVADAELETIPLEKDTLVLAVPNRLLHLLEPAQEGLPVGLSSCSQMPFAVVSRGQEMRQLFEKLCRIAGIQPNIYVEVVGISTAWTIVQSGIAATLLPKQFIQSGADKDVTLFEISQDTYVRQPAIVLRRGQFISEYARYAINLLTNQQG